MTTRDKSSDSGVSQARVIAERRWNWQTFTVAYWQEGAEPVAWVACTKEGFIAAQGATKAQAREALLQTIAGQYAVQPDGLSRSTLPADLRHHFDNGTETFVLLVPPLTQDAGGAWQGIETYQSKKGREEVLIVSPGRDGRPYVSAAYWDADDKNWWEINNNPTDSWGSPLYPTHWMPLPSPPTGGSALRDTGEKETRETDARMDRPT